MRLLWITNIPSPYRVDFFNELGKSCELTVLFEKSGASDRDNSWLDFASEHFEGIVMRGISYSADSAASLGVLKHLLRSAHDVVVVTNFSSPTGALAIAYLKATGRRYYLESDGGFPSGSRLRSWVKRRVIGGAQGYFSTSDTNDEYYLAYGAQQHQLIRYPFTSVREEDLLHEPPTECRKLAAKHQLGISQPKMVLAVGRFIHVKGFDVLLKACALLPEDTAVCIVGGEPTDEYIRLVHEFGLTSVRFAGFMQPADLRTYFTAADLFVLPTRGDVWGLVINEALHYAVPVITTDRCVAGLEMVEDRGCGHIVRSGSVEELRSAIDLVLADSDLRSAMQKKALEVAKDYTIERMAQRHEQVFHQRIDRNAL